MIKVDWVGFESPLDLGHKLGIEVEEAERLLVHGALRDVVIKLLKLNDFEFGG